MTLTCHSSNGLTWAESSRIIVAAVYAFCAGWAFNRHVTIHFGVQHNQRPHAALTRFLKRYGDWVRQRTGLPAAYVWILENPTPDFGHGSIHAHILIHVPPHLCYAFDCRVQRWLVGPGGTARKGAIQSDAIYYSTAGRALEYLEKGLLGILRYLLKGLETEGRAPFDITLKPQGRVLGKRAGHSEALGVQHRWRRIGPLADKAIFIAGPDSRRHRWLEYHVPELAGLLTRPDFGPKASFEPQQGPWLRVSDRLGFRRLLAFPISARAVRQRS